MTNKRPPRKRGLGRKARLLVTAVAGAAVLAGASLWIVYGTGAFAVESVVVRGASFTDHEQVTKAAGVAEGSAIAAVDTDEVARRVAKVPSVRTATVSRDWPHGIVVTISERKPRLAVPKDRKFILVDEAGVAFRTVSKQPSGTVKTTVSDPARDDAATQAVLSVLPKLSPELEKLLVSVEAPTQSRIELKLKGSRTVFWGDSSRSDRKAEVATSLLKRTEKHLDVSAPDVPTVS